MFSYDSRKVIVGLYGKILRGRGFGGISYIWNIWSLGFFFIMVVIVCVLILVELDGADRRIIGWGLLGFYRRRLKEYTCDDFLFLFFRCFSRKLIDVYSYFWGICIVKF